MEIENNSGKEKEFLIVKTSIFIMCCLYMIDMYIYKKELRLIDIF